MNYTIIPGGIFKDQKDFDRSYNKLKAYHKSSPAVIEAWLKDMQAQGNISAGANKFPSQPAQQVQPRIPGAAS